MGFWQDPQFGDRMITLMAALVLVLQITMVAQRWLVTNIYVFAIQSLLLAGIANTIAYFNSAPHIYIAAGLTLLFKAILLPVILIQAAGYRRPIRSERSIGLPFGLGLGVLYLLFRTRLFRRTWKRDAHVGIFRKLK